MEAETYFIFLGSKITADSDWSHEIKRHLLLGRKAMTNLDDVLKSRDITLLFKSRGITLLTKACIVKATVLSVVTCVCESWTVKKAALKNWCLQTVMLEKTPENPLDCKEIKPVNLKRNQPCILIGRTDADTEAPVFWSSYANSRLIGKVPDAGKYWGQ